ncbi:hypothetical protein CMI37_09540 [Candidatus Pacearchaeota archaeon]|nr:hypothetical protein [Candidatus Pacearchaeota archaeon]
MNQEVLVDVGGTLTFDCPQGRATGTPTCSLYKPDGTLLVEPAVTNDSVDTTINATAAAGATSLTVVSGTGIVAGRRYLIDNTTNEPEWVWVKSVSGTTVTLHDAVAYAYASSHTFRGVRMSVLVNAGDVTGDAARLEGYEARWEYAVGGITHHPIEQWDAVRTMWPPLGEVVPQWQFLNYSSGLMDDEMEGDGLDFSQDLKVADENVRRDLLARGTKPSRYRDVNAFQRPIMERCLLDYAVKGVFLPAVWQDDPQSWLDLRRREYQSALVDAMNTARSYDSNEDGVTSESERTRKVGTLQVTR